MNSPARPAVVGWPFLLGMLRREFRASWKRLLLLVLCIAAGVGGLVAVKSFSVALTRTIQAEARTLLAADLSLRSNRPFGPGEEAALADLRRGGARVARSVEFVSMAQALPRGSAPRRESGAGAPAAKGVLLVEARAVGAGYPFYGEVLVKGDQPFRQLLRDDTVLVHPSLLLHLGLQVGDSLRLGRRTFRIAGELVKEPDSPVQLMNIGPRVLLTDAGGAATGLIAPTSRVRYTALVKLPGGGAPAVSDVATVTQALKARLAESFTTVVSYSEAQPQVGRFLGQLTNYLNLTGLVALLLGGIGVAGAIRVFMAQKLDTLAVLKCLGATSRQLLTVYLAQALVLGLIGSLIGVALGTATQFVLAWLLSDFLPVSLRFALSGRAVAEGVLLGGLVTLWFALPPLLLVRRVPPARVFRRAVEPESGEARTGWRRLRALLPAASGILLIGALAYWQVGHWRITWIFVAALAGTAVVLWLSSHGLLWVLRRAPRPPGFVWRQGLTALYRPGNQTGVAIMSLGLSMLLLLAVFLIQKDLLRQVSRASATDQPNLFFIDIQKDQRKPFVDVVTGAGYPAPELIPVVRGRIVALNGRRLNLEQLPDGDRKRILTFEYAFTYRGSLIPGEHLLAGKFEPDPAVPGAQVSVADWWIRETNMKLGDTVTMDVQGVPVPATITSIRDIDWANRRANFSFVYLPGVLEAAPHIYVTGVHVASDAARTELQRRVVARLPNVTGFDVETVFELVQQILDRIALVIQFMAGFSLAVGLVILLGAIATTKYQRLREAVLLKTLGATRGMVARILALEYLLLGGLAGLIGTAAAAGLSYGLVTWVFEGRWYFALPSYLAAWGLSTLLVSGTGLLSSTDVLLRKPLDVLREE
jgi:putative ABC transport system permease protein